MRSRRFLLFHPVFIVALVALIVNDHVLKQEYPGWLTGKLSDFAGLIVFACVLAILFRNFLVSKRRIIVLHIAIGLLFVLWKALPTESLFRELSYHTGLPGLTVTHDLTDLMALLSLPVTCRLIIAYTLPGGASTLATGYLTFLRALVLVSASFAIIATPPPYFMHTNEQRIKVAGPISEARFLFVVEQTLINQGFVIDNRSNYGNGSYYFGFHSRVKHWAPVKGDSSWVVPKLYDADLFIYVDANGGYTIGPLHMRLGRKGWRSPTDSLIELNILNPLRTALGVASEQ